MRRRPGLRCQGGRGTLIFLLDCQYLTRLVMSWQIAWVHRVSAWSSSVLFRGVLDPAIAGAAASKVCPRIQVCSFLFAVPRAINGSLLLSLGSLLVMFG